MPACMRRSRTHFCRASCSANMCASACSRRSSSAPTSSSPSCRATARALRAERGGYVDRARWAREDCALRRRDPRHRLWRAASFDQRRARAVRAACPPSGSPVRKSIALIGSGLTMVDVLIGARRDGFQGVATIISRRGQLPRPHAPKGVVPQHLALPRSKRVSMLEASLRIACEMAEEGGTPWQAVINGLRSSLQDIWQALPVAEQARFLRHLRPVLRRAPPSPADRGACAAHGRVRQRPRRAGARVGDERRADGRWLQARDLAAWRERAGDHGGRPRLRLLGLQARSRPASDQGNDRGWACAARRPSSRARRRAERPGAWPRQGSRARGLFAIGPLCQGTLWEITAVPEIVRQADAAAISLAALQAPVRKSGTFSRLSAGRCSPRAEAGR